MSAMCILVPNFWKFKKILQTMLAPFSTFSGLTRSRSPVQCIGRASLQNYAEFAQNVENNTRLLENACVFTNLKILTA